MNNSLNCKFLFSFSSALFESIFSNFDYPWQIVPHIKEITERMIERGIDGYSLLCDGILIGKDARIAPSALITPPAIIGHNTEIRHGAYIRGSVIIGEMCVIGNSSEVKNSIIMDRSEIPHFNYVGDSVLGEHAHLGAGAICSNLRSDRQAVKIKVGSGYIDTGFRKLGAILGDNVEIGCGAVLSPGTVVGKNTSVYPLTMTRGYYPENSIVKRDDSVVQKRLD